MYRPWHHTAPRPWSPMTDDEWAALYPYVARRAPQGRQVGDLRQRMDAIFELAQRGYHTPWREAREEYGKPDTIARFFRRLTHRGMWHHLLESLARADTPDIHPLYRLEHFIVRACRKAARLGGLRLLFLIKRLGMASALNAPAWYLPDQTIAALIPKAAANLDRRPDETPEAWSHRLRWLIRDLKRLHRMAGGRTRIPRVARLIWP